MQGLGDGFMDVMHNAILDQDKAYIIIDLTNSLWNIILTLAVGVLVGLALAAIVYLTAGVAVPFIVGAFGGTVSAVSSGLIATVFIGGAVVGGAVFNSNVLPDDLVLPLYSITPEDIFSGEMPVFDVDFFNPNTQKKDRKMGTNAVSKEDLGGEGEWVKWDSKTVAADIKAKYGIDVEESDLDFTTHVAQGETEARYIGSSDDESENDKNEKEKENENEDEKTQTDYFIVYRQYEGGSAGAADGDGGAQYYVTSKKSTDVSRYQSIAYQLRPTIAKWYIALRNIAIVGSLSVLIYIAIRIIISSSSSDKSKYKQRLYDWVVSLMLIFIMHYIMAGSNLFVEKVSGLLNSVQKAAFAPVIVLKDDQVDKVKKALEDNKDMLIEYKILSPEGKIDDLFTIEDGKNVLLWPTNLMGFVRLKSQLVKEENSFTYAGYTIMFGALVIMTFTFAFTYFKRIIALAFLTMIAPFVAMTYALDKLKDGSAQGFNNWFKEYMVNLIIQPIHLLLYTVLVSSALELAELNPIYGIVALAFMMPAEKLVRRLFGVSATETQGLLAGPAGAALVMTGLNRVLGHRPPPPINKGAGNGANNAKSEKIRQTESLDTNQIFKTDGIQNNSKTPADKYKENENKNRNIDAIGKARNNSNIEENNMNDAQRRAWMQEYEAEEAALLATNNTNPNANIEENKINEAQKQYEAKKAAALLATNNTNPNASIDKQSPNQTEAQEKKKIKWPEPMRKIGNGVRRGMKYYGRGLGKNIANGINNGQIGRRAVRFAAGTATAALAGGVGLAAGVASGDLSKAGQYAAGAALGGYKLGSSTFNSSTEALNVPNAEEYFKRGYMGDEEYEKREAEKQIKRLKKEKMNDEFIRDFSLLTDMKEDEAKEYLEKDNFLEEGLRYGFSDANEFAAAKVAKEQAPSQEQAFAKTKLVKSMGSDINKFENDKEGKDNFMNSLKDRYRANGLTDEKELDTQTKILYKDLSKISKTLYKR